jgi:hypothetical protein
MGKLRVDGVHQFNRSHINITIRSAAKRISAASLQMKQTDPTTVQKALELAGGSWMSANHN